MDDTGKTKLTGRIYPAIQSCVNNRYKIIVGYFVVVGFLLVNSEALKKFVETGALVFLSIVFTLFVVHNSINYWINAKEQWCIEQNLDPKKSGNKCPVVDIFSSVVMLLVIWGGFLLLKCV